MSAKTVRVGSALSARRVVARLLHWSGMGFFSLCSAGGCCHDPIRRVWLSDADFLSAARGLASIAGYSLADTNVSITRTRIYHIAEFSHTLEDGSTEKIIAREASGSWEVEPRICVASKEAATDKAHRVLEVLGYDPGSFTCEARLEQYTWWVICTAQPPDQLSHCLLVQIGGSGMIRVSIP
jgi:hypothetical protein